MPDSDGPFINAAVICEKVLQEQDGVVSAIRVIDRIFFVSDADGRPLIPQQPVAFYISFKAGNARGRFSVEVHREKPSGEQAPVFKAPVLFEGEERGVNLIVNAMFEPDQEGLYWFDVLFEGKRVTRIPLRAIYQPLPTVGPPG